MVEPLKTVSLMCKKYHTNGFGGGYFFMHSIKTAVRIPTYVSITIRISKSDIWSPSFQKDLEDRADFLPLCRRLTAFATLYSCRVFIISRYSLNFYIFLYFPRGNFRQILRCLFPLNDQSPAMGINTVTENVSSSQEISMTPSYRRTMASTLRRPNP